MSERLKYINVKVLDINTLRVVYTSTNGVPPTY